MGSFWWYDGGLVVDDNGVIWCSVCPCASNLAEAYTRCCGGGANQLAFTLRLTLPPWGPGTGIYEDWCGDGGCAAMEGDYDVDFVSYDVAYTHYESPAGDYPTYSTIWGGAVFTMCVGDQSVDVFWAVLLLEEHRPNLGNVTCENGVCHNAEPECTLYLLLTTPENYVLYGFFGGTPIGPPWFRFIAFPNAGFCLGEPIDFGGFTGYTICWPDPAGTIRQLL